MDVRVGLQRKLSTKELMLLNCGVGGLLRVLWTARRSNQSIPKEISPDYSLEGLMLKLNLQCFDHLMWRTDSLKKTLTLCRKPPWEIPTITKVMQRRLDRQRQIRIRGAPWTCSSIYPKTRICLSYYFMPFTNSSDINRGLSPTNFLWRKST